MKEQNTDGKLWNIAVPVPLRQQYSYLLTDKDAALALPGMRVLVPFGRRKLTGYLISPLKLTEKPSFKIKKILSLLDTKPVFSSEQLTFLIRAANYYMYPLGEVLRGALPPGIDPIEKNGVIIAPRIREKKEKKIFPSPDAKTGLDAILRKAPARAQILSYIINHKSVRDSVLKKRFKGVTGHIKRLEQDNLVLTEVVSVIPDKFGNDTVTKDTPPVLNPQQQDAVEQIVAALKTGYQGFLLHGITGSGKTEVYLHAVENVLKNGKGALVLIPEITLTPQLVGRYRARFGDELAVIHSGMGDAARYQQWRLLNEGHVKVAIGVRSAVFAPVKELGLIIVDEEHDNSFKQERGFPYNARDMSLLRASMAGAVTVLGSATPSLESFFNAKKKKLKLLSLTERATKGTLPAVDIVNLKNHKSGPHGQSIISSPLFNEISKTVEKKEQVILFLNRRGYAPTIICKKCGYIEMCTDCAVSMTFHKNPHALICHYCGARKALPLKCPKCGSPDIGDVGIGTQKVERLLTDLFKDSNVARLDRDVGSGLKGEKILNSLKNREIDILVGTQMITKGHDFPAVTLVGVLQSDVGLHLPDFRAAEKTFQLLTQVAGRAGRAELKGQAVFQTYSPDHPAIIAAKSHDYLTFANNELEIRKELNYPPFGKLAVIRLNSPNPLKVEKAALQLADKLNQIINNFDNLPVVLLGPAPSPLEFIQNRYRWQLFLKSSTYSNLRTVLEPLINAIENPGNDVRIRLDIDPVSML